MQLGEDARNFAVPAIYYLQIIVMFYVKILFGPVSLKKASR